MAATFDELLPTDKDRLRLLLGDTQNLPDGALYTDEAYEAELLAAGSLEGAGVTLARGLVGRYAQMPDSISISGEFSISWRERIGSWNALIAAWSATGAVGTGVGGFSSVAAMRAGVVVGEYVPGLYTD